MEGSSKGTSQASNAMLSTVNIIDYCYTRTHTLHTFKLYQQQQSSLVQSSSSVKESPLSSSSSSAAAAVGEVSIESLNTVPISDIRTSNSAIYGTSNGNRNGTSNGNSGLFVISSRARDFGKRNERRRTTSLLKYKLPVNKRIPSIALSASALPTQSASSSATSSGNNVDSKRRKIDKDVVISGGSSTGDGDAMMSQRCRKHRRRMRLLLDSRLSYCQTTPFGNTINSTDEMPSGSESMLAKRGYWLETHHWHSKRMIMQHQYHHELALKHCNRGPKILRTYVKEASVVHDASYYRCITVKCKDTEGDSGVNKVIRVLELFMDSTSVFLQAMRLLANALTDNSFSSIDDYKHLLMVEYTELLYQANCFPEMLLGPVDICLASLGSIDGEDCQGAQVWLNIHPAIVEDVLTMLIDNTNELFLPTDSDTPCSDVIVEPMNYGFNRFSVRGKSSLAILMTLLNVNKSDITNNKVDNHHSVQWLFGRCKGIPNDQQFCWRHGEIFGLSIPDPRVIPIEMPEVSGVADLGINSSVPKQLTSKERKRHESTIASSLKSHLREQSLMMFSSHWATLSSRKRLHALWIPDHAINEQKKREKSRLLNEIRGLSLGSSNQSGDGKHLIDVPILLVRKQSAYSSVLGEPKAANPSKPRGIVATEGFDLLVPAGWSMVVWMALQQISGCRAIGVEEWERILLNAGELSFPRDYPDTAAGQAFWQTVERIRGGYWRRSIRGKNKNFTCKELQAAGSVRTVDGGLGLSMGLGYEIVSSIRGSYRQPVFGSSRSYVGMGIPPWKAFMKPTSINNVQVNAPLDGINSIDDPDVRNMEEYTDGCEAKSIMVVRQHQYLTAFMPLVLQNNSLSEQHELQGIIDSNAHEDFESARLLSSPTKLENDSMVNWVAIRRQCAPVPPSAVLLVSLLCHPTGRGVPLTGAAVFAPSENDCKQWLYHRHHRRDPIVTGSIAHRYKRLGDWVGVQLSSPIAKLVHKRCATSSRLPGTTSISIVEEISGRKLAGFVSSGHRNVAGSSADAIAIANCDVLVTFDSVKQFWYVSQQYQSDQDDMPPSEGELRTSWHSTRYSLMMYLNPGTTWLRPFLCEYI